MGGMSFSQLCRVLSFMISYQAVSPVRGICAGKMGHTASLRADQWMRQECCPHLGAGLESVGHLSGFLHLRSHPSTHVPACDRRSTGCRWASILLPVCAAMRGQCL